MTQRERIEEIKGIVKERRCYTKLWDAIYECIGNFAEGYAEEFEVTTAELRVATSELIFSYTTEEDVLALELMDEDEQEARDWLVYDTSEMDATTVANAIMGIHEGYRCEQEEVPEEILAWAKAHEDGDR